MFWRSGGHLRSILPASVLLLLFCTACASHPASKRLGRPRVMPPPTAPSKADHVRPGGFGASDAKKPALLPGPPKIPGAARDDHSDSASKTPDGGKSATASLTPRAPTAATPVPL